MDKTFIMNQSDTSPSCSEYFRKHKIFILVLFILLLILGLGLGLGLQKNGEEIRHSPFGYFCGYQNQFSAPDSVITYDKLLYSSQFGLQGDSPGIDINTGKFVSGFSGTYRVDFSLWTAPDPGEDIILSLYKNDVIIPETVFYSSRSPDVSGDDANTGGRSVLLHLDLGDELHLATDIMEEPAYRIIFCVSLEQFDV